MKMLVNLPTAVRQYLIITGNYWVFTLTDGALRMLVILHFYELGYSPLAIAMLFLFYEIFGVITNLFGGWLGAKIGLNRTMNIGLGLQIVALSMLLLPASFLSVFWVMSAQAISGIAKDLNKMSAKSSIKVLLPKNAEGQLYRWVAFLTGSKNALKGLGFFLGGVLLSVFGFQGSILAMLLVLVFVWLFSLLSLPTDMGKAKNKIYFTEVFAKNRAINYLSAARLFLFAARDVWFVIALPVYLADSLGWDDWSVGSFLACWVIGYGIVQSLVPQFLSGHHKTTALEETVLKVSFIAKALRSINGNTSRLAVSANAALKWALILSTIPAVMAFLLGKDTPFYWGQEWILIIGLALFGCVFAVNSSLHSYLIVSFARRDAVSLDVGFYYMANAMGRLLGTVLSGLIFQLYGLTLCLWFSAGFILLAALFSAPLGSALLPQFLNKE